MKKFAALIAISLCFFAAFAQQSFFDNYVYQNWNSFGSLNGTTANDIFQTSDGYINIGTYEGLARFDGVNFSTHKRSADNDLSFVSVRVILEDSRGILWIGSNDEGIQKITAGSKKTYTTQNGLPNNSVRALLEDRDGNIWIGTAGGVVYITPDGHMITPQFEPGTVSKGVISTQFYCDRQGRVWLLTATEKGLYVFEDGLFRTRAEFDDYDIYFATSFCQDLDGTYWVGLGDHGLFRVKDGIAQNVKTGTTLDENPTVSSYVADDGTVWFGAEKGLVAYSDGVFYEFHDSQIDTAKINKIICDREGNIWVATDRNGIGKLTKGKFKIIRLDTSVNSVTEGLDKTVWVGTDTGVLCYKNEVEVPSPLTQYTQGIRIRDVQTAKNGDILVSCYTKPGLLRYDGKNITSWTTDEGLAGNKVRVAIEAAGGDLYVGTTTGLSIIHKDGSIKNLKQKDGLENEYVMAIYQDEHGLVWIGTDGDGIYILENEKIVSHFNSADGLAGNVIFKITQEADGAYWICSGSGITRCPSLDMSTKKPAVCQNVNSYNGIQTDSVFQTLIDVAGTLWLTSNHGIYSTGLKEFLDVAEGRAPTTTVKYYNKNDGLDSDGPTSTAKSIITGDGKIWFTMVDGIAIFDPVKVYENPVMPLVQIETISVDNNIVVDNTLYKTPAKEITLKPGTKRVLITYSGISFDSPERITFSYKLSNFEDEYCTPTAVRTMSYTNLNPGHHEFYLNSINGDGFYSTEPQMIEFVQKPYFYQMPVFWLVAVLVVFGTMIGFFYLKEKSMQRENLRLEKMVQQRTAELNLEKLKSDELLHAILPNEIASALKDGIHSIGQEFDDVTILFSDIVEFTKTSSGHTASEIVDALNELFTLFDKRAQRMGIEKIKTIGDAYMAASGLPTPCENHAQQMVSFAKGMLEDIATYNSTAKIPFKIRIGLNCGPVTAGVIGRTKFIYDVWGNTVNVASRMESAATEGGIRVSQTVYEHLKDSGIKFSESIECNIKGKGLMTTYDIL